MTFLWFLSGSTCQTIDNLDCIFPFEYEGHIYWTCTDTTRSDLTVGIQWCATDANDVGKFKSFGMCKSNCPKGMYQRTCN